MKRINPHIRTRKALTEERTWIDDLSLEDQVVVLKRACGRLREAMNSDMARRERSHVEALEEKASLVDKQERWIEEIKARSAANESKWTELEARYERRIEALETDAPLRIRDERDAWRRLCYNMRGRYLHETSVMADNIELSVKKDYDLQSCDRIINGLKAQNRALVVMTLLILGGIVREA